jgi:hypothetical protein
VRPRLPRIVHGLVALAAALGCRPARPAIDREDFRGLDAIVLRNRAAKVVVIPAIGRVMRFDLIAGGLRASGSFWRHPNLGPHLAGDANGWINHGGDKAWPAPQAAWAKIAGKGWPPPRTFDAVAHTASIIDSTVELVSPVDDGYGVRVRRRIALHATAPVMTIETSFEKVQGPPVRVGVWTITQLESPDRMFVRLPERSAFPNGYKRLLPVEPYGLGGSGRVLSLARHPTEKTMLGSDGDALLWMGDGPNLLLENETARTAVSGEWPDGVHAQIYTSPLEHEKYVELELLERVRELSAGQAASMKVRYTLIPRSDPDPFVEAKRVGF